MSKLIVITGVSRGLGRALVAEFAKTDCRVGGCARSAEPIGELRREFPSPHRFDALDVSDDKQVGEWAKEVIAECGPPDLVVNNAGVINAGAPLWEVPPEEFARVVDVNVKGVFHVIRHFAPAMIARGAGVIVNLSSGWGRTTSPDVAPYCATKWAVEGLTRALADELPPGMAAVPLNPGVIHTDMLESCFGPSASSHRSPQEWARTAAPFLLRLGPDNNGEPLTAP